MVTCLLNGTLRNFLLRPCCGFCNFRGGACVCRFSVTGEGGGGVLAFQVEVQGSIHWGLLLACARRSTGRDASVLPHEVRRLPPTSMPWNGCRVITLGLFWHRVRRGCCGEAGWRTEVSVPPTHNRWVAYAVSLGYKVRASARTHSLW